MSTSLRPTPVMQALRQSHERLRALVEPLDAEQVRLQSYASEWSVAQVLSHLGSGAEIFGAMFAAGLSGEDPPGRESMTPVWDRWNAKSPDAQAADSLVADGAFVERMESLDDSQRQRFELHLFGRVLDLDGFVRMRLGEHAVHTWDVAVVFDPTATVAPDAVDELVATLPALAARAGRPGTEPLTVRVVTTAPERHLVIESTDAVAIHDGDGAAELPSVQMPAEALLRLVYGRLDPAHTTPLESRGVDLDHLRAMFPGF